LGLQLIVGVVVGGVVILGLSSRKARGKGSWWPRSSQRK
jgi:hypothetical protein